MKRKSLSVLKNILCAAVICATALSCHHADTLFEQLSSSKTNIDFTNKLEKHRFLSILYYLYYYNGGGVAIGDINNDGLPDIYFSANNKGGNKLYLNKGNFVFEDITDKAGVAGTSDWCTGVTMADVNGDGLLDIYVSAVSQRYGLKGHNELFINNGNNTFTESAAKYGLDFSGFTTQAVFFDYDHDGDLDCFILNQSHHPHANIVDTSARRKYDSLSGERLYRNDLSTTGKFTDVTAQAGIYQSNLSYGLGLGVADLNNDGWDDLYIGNDFHENDYYYINNRNGTFTESGAQHFGHYSRFSMGNDIADFNNDGQPDIVTVDMLPNDEKTLKTYGSDENLDIYKMKLERNGYQNQQSKNCLQMNNGNGSSFSEIGLMSGISATDWSWCPLFADFNNDGNKDLFISSGIVKRPVDLDYVKFASDLKLRGMDRTDAFDDEAINAMPDGSSHPFLFHGDGKFAFKDVSNAWGTGDMKGFYNGAAYADLDNDGNLDLVINCIDAPAVILKNNAPKKNNLTISLKGDGMNKWGIGTKVYLFAQGKMQYQELMGTHGFESSSDLRLHFGLDSITHADSLLVVWPGNKCQSLKNIPANNPLVLAQSNAKDSFDYTSYFKSPAPVLKEVRPSLAWKHKEDYFVDFNTQFLIPHGLSARGPKIAVADVNKDGLDDFFACGAKGQAGSLMIQNKNGSFSNADTATFNKYTGSDDVDAIFFDANKDGWPDLYVAKGGNEADDGNPALADKLYLNDGKGHFKEAPPGYLTNLYTNKSCIAAADIDNDGDIDLFVGGLANAKQYGIAESSYLLINDGHGRFDTASSSIINLHNLGMVTSAGFADINKDGTTDLVVTGEWMPMKIFLNNNGHFKAVDIPQSTGLWQSILVADINGDGTPDILAGNWGHNSKLFAGKDGPLKLYVKDFDKNGSLEQIMCYTLNGVEYSFMPKDELERSLPVLKKAYLKYDEVAGKSVQYMMYDLFKDYLELKAEVLGSSCFINDGKGGFTRMDLPPSLQMAPINTFQQIKSGTTNAANTFVAGGNFYDVVPYEGRYDAQPLAMFSFDNKNECRAVPDVNLSNIRGQVRDLKWISTAKNGQVLLVAKNNDSLSLFGLNNPQH